MKNHRWPLPVGALLCLLLVAPAFGQAKLRELEPGEKERLLAYRTPPPDVAGVPADAVKTASGLAYKILEPGEDSAPPGANDLVEVHFSGWNTDGVLLESSYAKNAPWDFQVNRAAPGVAEALEKMSVGAKARLWLSPELAEFRGERPAGMVVYEIELLSVQRAPEPPADLAVVPRDALHDGDGTAYRVLKPGRGHESPSAEDRVLVRYTVWSPQGVIGASSTRRGEPEVLVMRNVPAGARAALANMVAGERREVWVPHDRDVGFGGEEDQVWDLELLAVLGRPRTPPDVAEVPADARRTESGLAYKVLHPGDGKVKPAADSRVVVFYSTWSSDGELIDSSYDIGRPIALALDSELAPGFVEAVRMMVVGEKLRVWIPEELGFAPTEKRPGGLMVFDIDLLQIGG
jgi:FKBP-type peptidyl-prolyl cis-trans isomerase